MSSAYEELAELSLEERELLELLLRREGVDVSRLPIPRRGEAEPPLLSFAQERFWFLDQLEPGSAAYNVPVALSLTGRLDLDALRRAFDELLRRHEVLRTSFPTNAGQPAPVVAPAQGVALSTADLRGLPPSARMQEALRLATEEAQRPFDLACGPMLRVALWRLDEEEHVLLLTTHHLVTDGWSMILLMQEVTTLYEAYLNQSTPLPLRELPIQYADFALWQRRRLRGEILTTQLAYWKQKLAGAPFVLDLPTDHTRPPVQTYRGATRSFSLPAGLSAALRAFSRREGVTLYMTLLAALQTLLHRYTAQSDLVVGTAVSDRARAEIEAVIGPFSNSLLLRAEFAGAPSFRALLRQVSEAALEAYAHQELPFERLLEELQPARDLSRSPLFQVMFILHQSALEQNLRLPGLTVHRLPVDLGTTRFDLSLDMIDGGEELSGEIEYSTDLFDAATITRLVGHFRTLLEGVVSDPDQRVSDLPLLNAAERRQLLVEWNDTARDYPRGQCLHQLFEAQAARTPAATAVVSQGRRITYAELNQRANQLAQHLRSLGVGPEVRVGLMLERSWRMVIGLLGILKAGGAYVPLDPTYPKERLSFMLADAQAPVLLTQSDWLETLPAQGISVVCLDRDWESIARAQAEQPEHTVTSENLAYVIYTSGSTGKPKGVQITHRAVVNFLHSMRERPGITSEDVLLAVTTLSFDIAGLEIYLPLIAGARLELVSREVAADGRQLLDRLNHSGATLMQATPATWRLLLEAGWKGSKQLKILCGGEGLPRELANQLIARGSSLWNLYGPTETTIWSTACQLADEAGVVTVGRPIANTQLYLLDDNLQPVPVGVPGELHIGGVGLARGYLNRPELTAEKFIPDPFSAAPGARLYKTGDLARYLPDGQIECIGRLDNQIKVRGFRIEPGEIEASLRHHPDVREAVVVARDDLPGGRHLVAYVVPRPGQTLTGSELRSFLREVLPEYMVPSFSVVLEALPLTPNGKVNRRAFPVPGYTPHAAEKAFAPPQDSLEFLLAKIWESVLGVQPVGVQDNFFELGGRSLLAVRLFAQLERTLGKTLPLATLFQAPTVKQLAEVLRRKGWVAPWSSLVALQPAGSKPPLFCVHAAGGNVLFYRDLARHLGPDQPFYGLQAQGLDGKQPRHKSVPQMAAHYITEIRTLQPQGPYHLGGSSFGGVIAFEIAQQLHAQGQQVALLALFDTYGPGYPKLLPETTMFRFKLNKLLMRVEHHWTSLVMLEGRKKLSYLFAKAKKGMRLIKKGMKLTMRSFKGQTKQISRRFYTTLNQPLPEALRKVEEANWRAVFNYVPRVYPGRLTIFRASKQPAGIYPDPTLGWGEMVVGGIELYEVQGPHGAIISEPYVLHTAEKLRACLDNTHVADAAGPKLFRPKAPTEGPCLQQSVEAGVALS